MFSFLHGVVDSISSEQIVLDVGGVGYELIVSARTREALKRGEKAKLLIHMHLAEGLIALYGFLTFEEKNMFRRLIGISRVGPKVAISALGAMHPEELAAAIISEDEARLSHIPGLGKKTAQRIILELKEKIAKEEASVFSSKTVSPVSVNGSSNEQMQAISALIALGYDAATAGKAVASVSGREGTDKIESLVTAALKSLA